MSNRAVVDFEDPTHTLDPWLAALLVCPRDKSAMTYGAGSLLCARGHRYAVIEGIPILLVAETEQTHIEGDRSLAVAEAGGSANLPQFNIGPREIDPFVNNAIGATNGGLYQHLVGNLSEYPIPNLRLPQANGELFLEIGSNWGRWCIAAARAGFHPVGIDPSLKSIRAAKRVARQLGIEAFYLVADGRHLPFPDRLFDQIFSYSVLQHLSRENVAKTLQEISRVLRPAGNCQVQMPNKFGARCLYHQARRGFREGEDFDVRYWSPGRLLAIFRQSLGQPKLSVDGFFSLNAQISDARFLPWRYRMLVRTSEFLRKMSEVCSPLTYLADSLYITATTKREFR
jgi:SAM-dependent methyltransferase